MELRLRSRVRIVDNSALGKSASAAGKPAKIMHIYTPSGVGKVGDKVMVNVMGQKKRGYIVGCRQKQNTLVPRFDTNNVVLIEDNGAPTATRITHPIPSVLRGREGDFTKIISIATKFV